jgi:hypothetical protein
MELSIQDRDMPQVPIGSNKKEKSDPLERVKVALNDFVPPVLTGTENPPSVRCLILLCANVFPSPEKKLWD